jgi:hypothetical protein
LQDATSSASKPFKQLLSRDMAAGSAQSSLRMFFARANFARLTSPPLSVLFLYPHQRWSCTPHRRSMGEPTAITNRRRYSAPNPPTMARQHQTRRMASRIARACERIGRARLRGGSAKMCGCDARSGPGSSLFSSSSERFSVGLSIWGFALMALWSSLSF